MPTTHSLTPFYINSREGRERVTIVDVYEYAGRPLARVDSVDYGVRFSLPASLVHLDDELAKAQAIAAAHPLNPEGAYERLLARQARLVYRDVEIPATEEHNGLYAARVRLTWICPVCGGPRGEPFRAFSFDGSRRLSVSGWSNPCGHVDKYTAVRREARSNGLNIPAEVSR